MKFSELTPWRSSLSTLSPFWPFERSLWADRFGSDMDDFMRELENIADFSSGFENGKRLYPLVDVKETPESYSVDAELPGMAEKDIELEVINNSLFIKGKKERESQSESGYLYAERSHGPFCRKIYFDEEVNLDNVSAEFKNGILHIELKKKELDVPKPKKIEIHH